MKLVWLAASETSPHPSLDPLSISAETMEALPLASSVTVWSFAAAVGLVVSSMVKVAAVLEAFPHTSVAVNVTVTEPVVPQPLEKSFNWPSLPSTR